MPSKIRDPEDGEVFLRIDFSVCPQRKHSFWEIRKLLRPGSRRYDRLMWAVLRKWAISWGPLPLAKAEELKAALGEVGVPCVYIRPTFEEEWHPPSPPNPWKEKFIRACEQAARRRASEKAT